MENKHVHCQSSLKLKPCRPPVTGFLSLSLSLSPPLSLSLFVFSPFLIPSFSSIPLCELSAAALLRRPCPGGLHQRGVSLRTPPMRREGGTVRPAWRKEEEVELISVEECGERRGGRIDKYKGSERGSAGE